jgi:glycosyltransferase involved in cell wall biosynthesis
MAPLYRAFERLAAPLADVIVAVSPEEHDVGARVLKASSIRIRVIENGVDTAHFTPGGARRQRSEQPLIVCLGRLCRAKGQDIAVRALELSSHTDARLRLVGDGPARLQLLELARTLGVGARLELPGAVADSAPELRSADVVVVPSRWDGLSLALLEAMACGSAVVATCVPGSAALEGVGVLVEPEHPRQMARAVDGLLSDPRRRIALGGAARQRAKEHFDIRTTLDRTVALWNEMSAARRR